MTSNRLYTTVQYRHRLIRVRLLRPSKAYPARPSPGHGASPAFRYRVVLPAELKSPDSRLVQAVAHALTLGPCGHEHDCCGCEFNSVTVSRTNRARELSVVEHVGYNY